MSFVDMNDPEIQESLKCLLVTSAERIKLQSQPFNAQKACWVAEHKDGFVTGEIVETKGDQVVVKTSKGETVTVKKDDALQMNPPKYEKCEDMADMTYLNDATVLHNLRQRYQNWLIYTYSGLFCVTVNPYKRLPVYTMKMINMYRGKKKNEVPPHLYSIADGAYQAMLRDRENQSMLITGESGAGKTENTKKVIQYLAYVAASAVKADEGAKKVSLEDQIVSTNPVLEAYGNAKTTRNNNSSRFGKFIRIHFGPTGKIAGADIETYLLEKSRVTFQQPLERNYHIFYQLCSKQFPAYHTEFVIEPDAGKYFFVNQGKLTIDGVDDAEEMRLTDEAFDTLGFSKEEKFNMYKCTAACMIWGDSKWKQRPREEQAEADGTEECEKVSYLCGVDAPDLIKGLLKPRIKVGNEYVNKGQNKDQVTNSIGALSKAIFSRMFDWLVKRVNETLDVKTKRQYFIGVLDIAGFEIFDFNGFEQLCINYTNERLQQFFNHHMFVLEQEEYKKEGIAWEMMNFGLDLQACIDLIEKPLGILSILEEECIVPKASDKTFQEKLYSQHLGKHQSFGKPKPAKGKAEAHFELHHYAGTVQYNVTSWLDKNKDPINGTVGALFKNSKTNKLLSTCFADQGEDPEADKKSGGGGKKAKGGSMQTISSAHRDQLNKLMLTLKQTHPHFVRCIIPNELKTGGIVDAHLVMHQLHCNGVLEGIRICRKGFPNRMIYAEFKQRYSILAPNAIPKGFVDATKATADIIKEIKLNEDTFRLGTTKVFFRAGMLGQLEELRDAAVSKIIAMLQAQIRVFKMKKVFKRMLEQKLALSVVQRNIKKYLAFRNWGWWKLMTKIKPLLTNVKAEEELKAKEEEFKRIQAEAEAREKQRKELEENQAKILQEKNDMKLALEAEKEALAQAETKAQGLTLQKAELEAQLKDLQSRLGEEEGAASQLEAKKKKLETEMGDLKNTIQDKQTAILKAEAENKQKDSQIHQLQNEMAQQDESIAKLNKEKKRLEEVNQHTLEQLQKEEDKVNHLNKAQAKLTQTLDEANDNLEREKKAKADLDKSKKKLEGDLKATQGSLEELDRVKRDLEEVLKKKEIEIKGFMAKVEEGDGKNAGLNKKLKELQARIEELEEENNSERQNKSKVEKQRADLSRELEELNAKLEEAGGVSAAQVEITKKREAELVKLKRDLEDANLQHETNAQQLKQKSQTALAELVEQIDQLQKAKNKLEKEKQSAKAEADEFKDRTEQANKGKASAEKLGKQLEQQLSELNSKLEESGRQNAELGSLKAKLQQESGALASQIEELESQIGSLTKAKQAVSSQLDEAKRSLEDETKAKGSLSLQLRNLTADLDQAREQFEEEQNAKAELQKLIAKASLEAQQWKSKYETDGVARAGELEDAKRKLAAKLAEAEEQASQAVAKCASLEKSKQHLQSEVEDLMIEVERANGNASALDKKAKQVDKLVGEWKSKFEDANRELESAQKEARQYSTDVLRLKAQNDEISEQTEAVKRENKSLSDEVKELVSQLSEGGKNVHDLAKSKRSLEVEKEELLVALGEAEGLLQQETAKVTRAQLETSQVKQDIDRKLREKEEEFENTRRTHQKALESMQVSLDGEIKGKNEALKLKKKLEADINELEVQLDHANRNSGELQKNVKRLQQLVDENSGKVDEALRQRDEARDVAAAAERRFNLSGVEKDDIRASLEQAERARKLVENDLQSASDKVSSLIAQNTSLNAQKRKLESDFAAAKSDLDEVTSELRNSEEAAKRATAEAARLADEAKRGQELAANFDRIKRNFEQQVKDLQARLSESEANASKGGKRAIQSLEQKVQELEAEVIAEQRRHQESTKETRKHEKQTKELAFLLEESKKAQSILQDSIDNLQNKLKVYKKQAEEAEDIAAVNLAKFRKAQHEIEEAEEKASIAEAQLAKLKAKSRSTDTPQRETRGGSVLRK